jgi:type IV secretion system protein VirB10
VSSGQGAAASPRNPQQEAKEAMQADDDKREHDSLSAGLIVRSERLRRDTPTASSAPPTPAAATVAPTTTVPNPSTSFPPAGNPPAPRQAATPPAPPAASGPSSLPEDLPPNHNCPAQQRQQAAANRATGPTYKLFEGTLIETVLTNRLNSSFTGPVECMVTIDIWSHSRQHLLIPQGTKVLGEARRVTHIGQDRLAVVFHRLIMRDGYSVSLDNFTGLSQIGETGLSDKVNHHYVQMFGVSVALGAISGLAVRGANLGGIGASQSSGDAFRQGFSQQLSQEGTQILDKYLNVLPTVTIREGIRVKVYLLDDLSLPAYDQHKMATDL